MKIENSNSFVNIQFSVACKPLTEANVNTMEENQKDSSEHSLYLLGYMIVKKKVYILTYIHLQNWPRFEVHCVLCGHQTGGTEGVGLRLQPIQDLPGRLGAGQTAGRPLLYKGPMAA